MKKITTILLLGVLSLTAYVSAQAADFSYNYAQVSYDDIEYSIGSGTVSIDGDGFALSGALEITPDFFITADYKTYDMDAGIDFDVWDIGLGYHRSINTKTDFVAGIAIGNIEIAFVDLDTWSAYAGVRYQLNNKLELAGRINYVDYDGNDSDTRIGANALYKFKKDLLGVLALEFGDVNVISLGARFEF